jgi:hypothetical protein
MDTGTQGDGGDGAEEVSAIHPAHLLAAHATGGRGVEAQQRHRNAQCRGDAGNHRDIAELMFATLDGRDARLMQTDEKPEFLLRELGLEADRPEHGAEVVAGERVAHGRRVVEAVRDRALAIGTRRTCAGVTQNAGVPSAQHAPT